jgi:2-polyprenyl-3-methyl-5-hydroxy-6-metoxy-1,4-benzoquinol methylase
MCPPPKTLLDLGSGCGRLTRPMIEAGYQVTAVDNSAEMLADIHHTDTVLSDIEYLDLALQIYHASGHLSRPAASQR